MSMTSSRSYLIKALYEWILDNDCTPHLLVFADAPGVEVPQAQVKDSQIMLNISPTAVVNYFMDKEAISFNARFGGVPTDVYIPHHAVMGIMTKESGQGMMFDLDELDKPSPPDNDGNKPKTTKDNKVTGIKKASGKPTLRVVK